MNPTKYNDTKIFSARHLMSLGLAVIAVGVAATAMKWPFKTALFPVAIGVFVFVLCIVEFSLSLFGKQEVEKKGSAMDFEFSEGVDKALAFRRTIIICSWIVGFLLLILLVGFSIAVPLFVFSYIRAHGEKWVISIMMGVSAWVLFYGLFIWLLNTPLMEGWIFKGLRLIGVG